MIRGIDVSSVQGVIDWPSVAHAGYRFAIVKCSTGNDSGRDAMYRRNVDGAQAAGLVVGPYHFAYPLASQPGNPTRDPAQQARIAFDKCEGLGSRDGELPPAVDLEWPAPQDWERWGCTGTQIAEWGLAYVEAAHALWGREPIVYTYPWWWRAVHTGAQRYARCPLWMADYAAYADREPPDGSAPGVPSPWTRWTLWQHSGGGIKLPNGVPVDGDVFNGTEADLAAFCRVVVDVTDSGRNAPVYGLPDLEPPKPDVA